MNQSINIKVNGEPMVFSDGLLSALLEQYRPQTPFAVAVNTQFVPKARYAQTPLHEGDEVEIVRPVVGG